MLASSEKAIIDVPRQLFNNYGNPDFCLTLLEKVHSYIEARHELPPPIRARLTYYPKLVKDLIRSAIIPRTEENYILADPTVRCSVVLEDYKPMAPLFEDSLYSDALSLERILRDARYTQRPTLRNDSEYMKMLLELDPERYYRLSPPQVRDSQLEQLMADSEKFWQKSPSWAYLYVSTHQREHIEPSIIEQLAKDENYLYLAVYLLKVIRGMPVAVWSPMVDLVRSPKWAFHFFRDELSATEEQKASLSAILHKNPPWLAEWWHVKRITGEELDASFKEAAKQGSDHPCAIELILYHRTLVTRARHYAAQGLAYGT